MSGARVDTRSSCDIINSMKFVDSTLKDKLSRDRLRMGVGIGAVAVLNIVVLLGVYTMLDSRSRAERARRNAQADVMLDALETTQVTETSVTQETSETSEGDALVPVVASESTMEIIETAESSEISAETEQVTEQTTAQTTAETTADPNAVVEFYTTVYASSDINLRSGPGTDYDVVRLLHVGEQIDVTGRTGSGWYRTYSGNYVMISYTSEEPVATTAAPTTATTTQATTASTTQATQAPSSGGGGSIDGMTYYGVCHITYYGPQPRGDGTYSVTTATGTTCSEGRTCAADWDIFPAGTTIYIPNDPLGGDGYYTVEDSGPGVNGAHIDIFSEGGNVPTDCEVYIVG